MALTPLKETTEVYSRDKRQTAIELLRSPAKPTDYAINAAFAIIQDMIRMRQEDVMGTILVNGFLITNSYHTTFTISAGKLYHKHFCLTSASAESLNISTMFPFNSGLSGHLFLKITERRFKSDDPADPLYGNIVPADDLTINAGSVFDTHNEWRYKYEWYTTLGAVPLDDESDPDIHYFYIDFGNLQEIGEGEMYLTRNYDPIEHTLQALMTMDFSDYAHLSLNNRFTAANTLNYVSTQVGSSNRIHMTDPANNVKLVPSSYATISDIDVGLTEIQLTGFQLWVLCEGYQEVTPSSTLSTPQSAILRLNAGDGFLAVYLYTKWYVLAVSHTQDISHYIGTSEVGLVSGSNTSLEVRYQKGNVLTVSQLYGSGLPDSSGNLSVSRISSRGVNSVITLYFKYGTITLVQSVYIDLASVYGVVSSYAPVAGEYVTFLEYETGKWRAIGTSKRSSSTGLPATIGYSTEEDTATDHVKLSVTNNAYSETPKVMTVEADMSEITASRTVKYPDKSGHLAVDRIERFSMVELTADVLFDGTVKRIDFNNVLADPYSFWDAVNFGYVPERIGWYQVLYQANISAESTPIDPTYLFLDLYKNGSFHARLNAFAYDSGAQYAMGFSGAFIFKNSADTDIWTIRIGMTFITSNGWTILGTGEYSITRAIFKWLGEDPETA